MVTALYSEVPSGLAPPFGPFVQTIRATAVIASPSTPSAPTVDREGVTA